MPSDTPSFNPSHHPILDLDPHEFVRKANAAGIKLAVLPPGEGAINRSTRCACALGAAAYLIDPSFSVTNGPIRLDDDEFMGVMEGFDDMQIFFGRDLRLRPGCAAGRSYGVAIRAAALEIQGDLEPTPLKSPSPKGADA